MLETPVGYWVSGADPGVGKRRGTNRLNLLGRARFSSLVLHFEAANNHLLAMSHCLFLPFCPFQMVVKSLKGSKCFKQLQHDNYFRGA